MDPSQNDVALLETPELRAGRPLLINRAEDAGGPRMPAFGDKSRRSLSFMYAPLVWQGNLFALVSVHSYTQGRYGPRDLDLFASLANQCGAAVARVLAEDSLRGKRDELERVQMQYSAILRATPNGLAILGRDWKVRYANDAMQRILDPGREFAKQVERRVSAGTLPHGRGVPGLPQGSGGSTGPGSGRKAELKLRRLNGEEFWCELSAVRMDPSQTASGFVVTLSDVTGRHEAEQARRDAESRFQGVVEQSLVGVFIFHEGRFAYANHHAAEMLGYSVEELLALPDALCVLHPDDSEDMKLQLAGLVSDGRPTAVVSGRATKRDGRVIHVTLHATRVELDDQPAIIGMILDATELWQAERENDMVARLAGQLAAVRTREQVAEVMRQATEVVWNWDTFGISVRHLHGDDFTRILAVDTVEGVKRAFPPFVHEPRHAMADWKDLERGVATLVANAEVLAHSRPVFSRTAVQASAGRSAAMNPTSFATW